MPPLFKQRRYLNCWQDYDSYSGSGSGGIGGSGSSSRRNFQEYDAGDDDVASTRRSNSIAGGSSSARTSTPQRSSTLPTAAPEPPKAKQPEVDLLGMDDDDFGGVAVPAAANKALPALGSQPLQTSMYHSALFSWVSLMAPQAVTMTSTISRVPLIPRHLLPPPHSSALSPLLPPSPLPCRLLWLLSRLGRCRPLHTNHRRRRSGRTTVSSTCFPRPVLRPLLGHRTCHLLLRRLRTRCRT